MIRSQRSFQLTILMASVTAIAACGGKVIVDTDAFDANSAGAPGTGSAGTEARPACLPPNGRCDAGALKCCSGRQAETFGPGDSSDPVIGGCFCL